MVCDLECHLIQAVPSVPLERFDERLEMPSLPVREALSRQGILLRNLFLG